MSNTETINVACTIDNNYVQHCAVMLASLFANNPEFKFKIFIITDGINTQKQKKLAKFFNEKNKNFSLVNVKKSIFKKVPVSEHFSVANYFRILIPELVDDNMDKILFLDSDMIIRRSIAPLWDIDICNYSHAAVENPLISTNYKQNLGISENDSYFNSGVLLINLKMWKQFNVVQKTMKFIAQYPEKIHYVDQDALNYVLENKWLRIESQWNAQGAFFTSLTSDELNVTSEEYRRTKSNPAILHFTGGGACKPWHYNCSHPLKEEYYKYLSQTPWRDSRPIGRPNLLSSLKAKAKALVKKTK